MSTTLDTSLLHHTSTPPLLLSPHPADLSSPRHGLPPPAPPATSPAHPSYSPFTAYCFTVNYILGVGVLGMPFAFVKAGLLLSILCLAVVTCMAVLTALWLSEVGMRAARLERRAIKAMADAPQVQGGEGSEVLIATPPTVHNRRIEMNELVDIFLGVKARRVYEVLLCIYMIGALWSYSAVFSQSMDGQLHIDSVDNNYLLYLALFACVVIPLTCLEMTELKPLAIALAIFRFVSLTMMMLTSLLSLYAYPYREDNNPPISTRTSSPYVSDISLAVFAGLSTVFPVSIYSQIFHHSVPGLAHPLQDKRKLPSVFTSVLITTFALYAGLGVTVGLYYGSGVKDVCTLNWVDYSGEKGVDRGGRGGIASFISYLIVLFPPIDIISAFPLNAITLANNIMSAIIPPHLHSQRRYVIPFRLVAALLPLIGASFVKSLDAILHYTGCVGVLIAFLYPVMLQWQSQKVDERGGDEDEGVVEEEVVLQGKLKEWVNGKGAMGGVLAFSVVGLIAVIVLSITE